MDDDILESRQDIVRGQTGLKIEGHEWVGISQAHLDLDLLPFAEYGELGLVADELLKEKVLEANPLSCCSQSAFVCRISTHHSPIVRNTVAEGHCAVISDGRGVQFEEHVCARGQHASKHATLCVHPYFRHKKMEFRAVFLEMPEGRGGGLDEVDEYAGLLRAEAESVPQVGVLQHLRRESELHEAGVAHRVPGKVCQEMLCKRGVTYSYGKGGVANGEKHQ